MKQEKEHMPEIEFLFKKSENAPIDFHLKNQENSLKESFPELNIIESSDILLGYKRISNIEDTKYVIREIEPVISCIERNLFLSIAVQIREYNGDITILRKSI